jgi:hypothetical protein
MLEALHATHPHEAQDGECAVPGPSSSVPGKPRRLLMHTGEVTPRALHLVLGPSADSTAASEPKPVASVEAQPDGREEQQPGERQRSRARTHKSEQRRDGAGQRRLAGVREPAVLLTARMVHAATASSS